MVDKKRGRRKRPEQDRSRLVVSSIVEGAIQLLRRSDRPFSVNDIAARAGVGIGSIYRYFSNREGVMDAVVDRLTATNFEQFDAILEAPREGGLVAIFHELVEAVFDVYVSSPALTQAAVRAIFLFDRAASITLERDRVVRKLSRRIADELSIPVDVVEPRATSIVDMAIGAALSSVYRSANEAEVRQAKDVVHRAAWAELNRLISP